MMIRSMVVRLGSVLIAATLAACASSAEKQMKADEQKNSGFLGDYSKLQETKDADGKIMRQWASPKLTPANYNAIILDPVIYYPEPKPSEKVDAQTLQQILAYVNETLQKSLSQRFKLVNEAGPGVVRMQSAISAVAAEGESLSAYQYVPIAFVATMTTRAVAGTPQRAYILVETQVKDSVTNEILAQRVKVGTGEGVRKTNTEGTQVVTMETVKPLLDEIAAKAYPALEKFVKPIK